MDCELAREALSARIDGEPEPVPAARVDEHLADCPDCQAWYSAAESQAAMLRSMTEPAEPDLAGPIAAAAVNEYRVARRQALNDWPRWLLGVVGIAQTALATAQMAGVDFGMLSMTHHQSEHSTHLMNETSAWSLAIGAGMILAAVWPTIARGLSAVLGIFVVVLIGYVVHDVAEGGVVTGERVASHIPAVAGMALAFWIARRSDPASPRTAGAQIVLPRNAALGRRSGHLRSADPKSPSLRSTGQGSSTDENGGAAPGFTTSPQT